MAASMMALVLGLTVPARAQTAAEIGSAAGGAGDRGRILLVLPFDNRSDQPNLDWIREAAPELLSSRLNSAGFAPMSRTDRLYALDHLGLPQGFQPSRASSLKLAQTLDADSIIVGSYLTDGTQIVAEARLVDVPRLRMSEPVTARGEMRDLIAVFDSLAWKLTRQLDPGFSGSEETFVAAGKGVRLDAFEQYIRGIAEADQAERLGHLKQAVMLNPELGRAWMALGREDYNGQQYEQAAAAFAKVGRNDPDALEAGFYRGLSLLFSGDYPRAEEAFGAVARVLPLAEVLNNQGVALARQGKDGIPLFRQAEAADPHAADYHFNLAVSLKRHGDKAEALAELAQCLHLRSSDSEAQELLTAWKEPAAGSNAGPQTSPNATPAAKTKPDPLERIERSFDAAAFQQAALMLDQIEASRLAQLPPRQQAQKLAAQARDYLERGLLLEAERIDLAALAVDGRVAEAHAGLAEVRERTGDAEAARKEARTSLELLPSVDAYLVMGRLDLAARHMNQAGYEAGEALKLDPASKPALELRRQIETKEGQKQ
jgi:tetratricopeptide (TPR) repeat protein